MFVRSIRRAAAVVALATATALAASAGAASASDAPHAAAQPFAAQSAAAGLTSTQAAGLQLQVNQILARDGGTQVAANEIALPHGAAVLLVLPGQKYARVLPGAVNLGFAPTGATTARISPEDTSGTFTPTGSDWTFVGSGTVCHYHYLCAWQGLAGTGTQFNVSTCNEDQELPGSGWSHPGSFINNQTAGVRAYFLGQTQHVYYTTPGSGYWDSGYNWDPIWYLDACA